MTDKREYTPEEVDDAIVDVASNYGALREAIAKLKGPIYDGSPTTFQELSSNYDMAIKARDALRELAPSGMTETDPKSLRGRLKIVDLERRLDGLSGQKIRISTEPEEGES